MSTPPWNAWLRSAYLALLAALLLNHAFTPAPLPTPATQGSSSETSAPAQPR